MSRTCSDCYFWKYAYKSGYERFGTCTEPMVEVKIIIDHESPGESVIHTAENFGCNRYTPPHMNALFEIKVDDDKD